MSPAQWLFLMLLFAAVFLFTRKIRSIRRNILLGKEEEPGGHSSDRWKNVLLLALGQKKMFSNPFVAVLHLFIYVGFIIINIEVLEILLDGMLGTHRLFLPLLDNYYTSLINTFEFLALSVVVACVLFLARRNIAKVGRLNSNDLDGWPRKDANAILIIEIILMSLFLVMNASDRALQQRDTPGYHHTGDFALSSLLLPLFTQWTANELMVLERVSWWLHIAGILAFLNYLPYSKHLHILLAFPNAYYARSEPKGKMTNMPSVQNEVLYALQPDLAPETASPPQRFGAKDVSDLSWHNLLDAYSCTECGRCTAACPAHLTGKLLSPRKIMMATRDRLEEVGRQLDKKTPTPDEKDLFHYITPEEIRACTTCNACVEACPVSISPLEIILEMRRALIMEDSNAPKEWNTLFGNIENNFAPWKFSPDDRASWAT